MNAPDISVVLPVYNQADHIEAITRDYLSALKDVNFTYELLLVVNNCRDESYAVCSRLAQEIPQVVAIHLEEGGWGLAVKAGLQAARGNLLCYTNSARTSPIDLALILLYGYINAGKVIKANRKIRESVFRRVGSLLYNLECRALFDFPYWDVNGTPKIFPREYDQLIRLTENGDLIDLEFNVICHRNQYPMLEVPIFASRRHGGKSTTNLKSALNMYLGAFRLWRKFRKAG